MGVFYIYISALQRTNATQRNATQRNATNEPTQRAKTIATPPNITEQSNATSTTNATQSSEGAIKSSN